MKLLELSLTCNVPGKYTPGWAKAASVSFVGQNVLLKAKDFEYADTDGGFEDFSDPAVKYPGLNYPQFLRTGYPNFPLDPATSLNTDDPTVFPKCWKYPTDEQTKNPGNYKKAVDDQYGGFDGVNKVPWYL